MAVEVKDVPGKGRGMFAATAFCKGEVVFRTSVYSVAMFPDVQPKVCLSCFKYSGHYGKKYSNFCCSISCEQDVTLSPACALYLQWRAVFLEELRFRNSRRVVKEACDPTLPSGVTLETVWDSAHIVCPRDYVFSDSLVLTTLVALSTLSRRAAGEQQENTQHDDNPTYHDVMAMQDNESAFYAHLGLEPSRPFSLADIPRLECLVFAYRLLRASLARAPHTDRPALLAVLGPDSLLFRSVVFREMANSFGLWEAGPNDPDAVGYSGRELLGVCIYPKATFFNHSCIPNVRRVAEYGPRGETAFEALVAITPGDELTIAYCDLSYGVERRREYLLDEYFFVCDCDRCRGEL